MTMEIKVTGVKRLRGQLEDRRRLLLATPPELEEWAEKVRSVAYTLAPKDTEEGARGLHLEPIEMGFAVVSNDIHMNVMEFGRSPGEPGPPVEAITGWAVTHGFLTKSSIYLLAMKIGREGIKARRFMRRAAEYGRSSANGTVNRIRIRLENTAARELDGD